MRCPAEGGVAGRAELALFIGVASHHSGRISRGAKASLPRTRLPPHPDPLSEGVGMDFALSGRTPGGGRRSEGVTLGRVWTRPLASMAGGTPAGTSATVRWRAPLRRRRGWGWGLAFNRFRRSGTFRGGFGSWIARAGRGCLQAGQGFKEGCLHRGIGKIPQVAPAREHG